MKTPSDYLFRLIRSMSASEKRYLKLHYCSPKSSLTELFNFVNALNEYDEQLVKQHFSQHHPQLCKNLKVYKVQLIEVILKSLTSFHAKKKIPSLIRQGIEELTLLTDRGLYDIAHNKTKKLYQICRNNQLHDLALAVLSHRLELCQLLLLDEEAEIFVATRKHLEAIRWKLKLRQADKDIRENFRMVAHLPNSKLVSNFSYYKELIENRGDSETKRDELSLLRDKIHAELRYQMESSQEEGIQLKRDLARRIQEGAYQLDHSHHYQWSVLIDLLHIYDKRKQYALMLEVGTQLKQLKKELPLKYDLAEVFWPEIKYFYQNHQRKELRTLLEEGFIDRSLGAEFRPSLYLKKCLIFCVMSYLEHGESKKVQALLHKFYGHFKTKDTSIDHLLHVIELIHHYESSDFRLIDYMLHAFLRKVKRGKKVNDFHYSFVQFMGNWRKAKPVQKMSLISSFRTQLELHQKDSLVQLWHTYQLSDWLNALSNQRTFVEERQKISRLEQIGS